MIEKQKPMAAFSKENQLTLTDWFSLLNAVNGDVQQIVAIE